LSLIVVIGLVLSISGAAYAAVVALRDNWAGVVKTHLDSSASYRKDLDEADDDDIIKPYKKHDRRFTWAMRRWNKSQWAPTVLLGLASVLIAIDVIALDWSKDEGMFLAARPSWWSAVYKWSLGLLIVADISTVFVMWRAFHRICDEVEELGSLGRLWVKQRTTRDMAGPAEPEPPED
jgi:hypothetical protein